MSMSADDVPRSGTAGYETANPDQETTPGYPTTDPEEIEDPMIGQVIDGRYRIDSRLGEGGMGEVYAASHVHIEKRVAIKLLRKEVLTNEEAVQRFRQEARSASSIGHRNIIAIEDFGMVGDRVYLCMELLDGAPFNDLLEQPMSIDRVLNILIQTCHGLAAAHQKGIVHRDMKPENIFVTSEKGVDVPKLLDFGIAKVSQSDANNHLTRTGTIFGTPYYMAPEQALGQPIDHRADIYAVGVIMYEALCGEVPFQGDSFMGILTQHITANPKSPLVLAQENNRPMNPDVEAVILRAMRKEPNERYGDMTELVNALVEAYRTVAGPGMSSYIPAPAPTSTIVGSPQPVGSAVSTVSGAHGVPRLQTAPVQAQTGQPPNNSVSVQSDSVVQTPMPVVHASESVAIQDGSRTRAKWPFFLFGSIVGAAVVAFLIMRSGGVAPAPASSSTGTVPGATTQPGTVVDAAVAPVTVASNPSDTNPGTSRTPGTQTRPTHIPPVDSKPASKPPMTAKPDASVTETPDPPEKPEPVPVMVASRLGAVVYRDGKRIGVVPQLFNVLPDSPIKLQIRRGGYRPAEVVIDGSKTRVVVKLIRIRTAKPKSDRDKLEPGLLGE